MNELIQRNGFPYNGLLNVYKEAGYTSHDVVAILRGILKQKKIGHTGTLDPDATGVLPICLGNATKLCDLMTEKKKEYQAVAVLGIVTDTQDCSGKILEEKNVKVSEGDIIEVVNQFIGETTQIPPMYSALKVNGVKLYELARRGIEVERAQRGIVIDEMEVLNVDLEHNRFEIRVSCSKGTYIRTLIHDMGQALGCGASMERLIRTRSGEFKVEDAFTIQEIKELVVAGQLDEKIVATDLVFIEYKGAFVCEEYHQRLENGNTLKQDYLFGDDDYCNLKDGEKVRIYSHLKRFYGVYEFVQDKLELKPYKMFF